jgi:hypothetical protein
VVRTKRGFRLVQGGLVLSEVRDHPGPTHTLFDALAACIAALAPGERVAMLGFAAGGVVAPLRAMGFGHPLQAVDLDTEQVGLFRHVSDAWAGEVRVAQADAVEWLKRSGGGWHLLLDDLSVETSQGVTKPRVTWEKVPSLAARRLAPGGVFVCNLLPVPGIPWSDLVARVRAPWRRAAVVHLEEYENRFVLAGRSLEPPGTLSRRIRRALRSIQSTQAELVSVRRA